MARVSTVTGVVGITGLYEIRATGVVTITGARPRRKDPAVEVLATRAVLYGRGTTAAGYRMFNGYPLLACWRSWPVDGYGPSYPVTGLTLRPGDVAKIVFYVRSGEPGRHTMTGYEIDYRDAQGRAATARGDTTTFEMALRAPGTAPDPADTAACHPDRGVGWVSSRAGYPG